MHDRPEVSFLDRAALDEIEMTSQLMIAASGHAGHLSQHEVDLILGVAAG
jgi:hypothetical protein